MTIKQIKHSKKIIAVIEDDKEMRSVIQDFLEPYYDVYAFSNPREFLDAFSQSLASLSAIISDVHMPEIDGFELLDILNKSTFAPPVIMISAHVPLETELGLKRNGAKAFLRKPFRLSNLLEIVQSLSAACFGGKASS